MPQSSGISNWKIFQEKEELKLGKFSTFPIKQLQLELTAEFRILEFGKEIPRVFLFFCKSNGE